MMEWFVLEVICKERLRVTIVLIILSLNLIFLFKIVFILNFIVLGDSGGPLQVQFNDTWFQVGLTSFGVDNNQGLIDQKTFPGNIFEKI